MVWNQIILHTILGFAHLKSFSHRIRYEQTLESAAEPPVQTLAVSRQVKGDEAVVGQQYHSDSFGEDLPNGIEHLH